jgi:hypothetical protein
MVNRESQFRKGLSRGPAGMDNVAEIEVLDRRL